MKVINTKTDRQALKELLNRNQFEALQVNAKVTEIIEAVKKQGDQALRRFTTMFDGVDLTSFKVTDKEVKEAYASLNQVIVSDLKQAKENLIRFHQKQIESSFRLNLEEGSYLEERVSAIEKVGLYVPGGTAPLPSTVLMNAVPAKLAGVKKTVMVSPPNKYGKLAPSIIVAADLAGVDEIYKIGGAQAIAALAFGTEIVPKVDKIVGPGNRYVTIAKRLVNGYVGIDLIAGPSEIAIIADETANPEYIAADLLSQAEHDLEATSILITPSEPLIRAVQEALDKQLETLSRKAMAKSSLKDYGVIILTESVDEAITISNQLAPEHLEIMTVNNDEVLAKITQAGSVFVGEYSSEPVGDYFAGTNHTLPTSGTARFSSPLSVRDFVKRTQVIYYTKTLFKKHYQSIARLANEEGLTAHAKAILIRSEGDDFND